MTVRPPYQHLHEHPWMYRKVPSHARYLRSRQVINVKQLQVRLYLVLVDPILEFSHGLYQRHPFLLLILPLHWWLISPPPHTCSPIPLVRSTAIKQRLLNLGPTRVQARLRRSCCLRLRDLHIRAHLQSYHDLWQISRDLP